MVAQEEASPQEDVDRLRLRQSKSLEAQMYPAYQCVYAVGS